jgi:hypothetical protein
MNRPCMINFHGDAAPLADSLPERYRSNVTQVGNDGEALALVVQHAFYVDYAPDIVRTRVGGTKGEDPVDFFQSSISFIEWYYGDDAASPSSSTKKRN